MKFLIVVIFMEHFIFKVCRMRILWL
jgi:hypothetical protein